MVHSTRGSDYEHRCFPTRETEEPDNRRNKLRFVFQLKVLGVIYFERAVKLRAYYGIWTMKHGGFHSMSTKEHAHARLAERCFRPPSSLLIL